MSQSQPHFSFSFSSVLDSALNYLQDILPPPIYSIVVNLFSHTLSLFSASFQLLSSLAARDPRDWDTQTILPPLISIFVAYLALLSLYRTTTWMIRTSVWFAKWGSILAILIGSVGYLAGNAQVDGNRDLITSVLSMISGQRQEASLRTRKPHSTQRNGKPKAWDSFERHQEWQYQHEGNQDEINGRDIMQHITGIGEQILGDQTWWKVAKGVLVGDSQDAKDTKRKRESKNSKYSQSR
ncbi:hypothetical protein BDQ17DRAFT_777192 [Cyathus striatus]|nr:hypothetical protein BDQ17DRAFT_777192 [Cyathus striatus]